MIESNEMRGAWTQAHTANKYGRFIIWKWTSWVVIHLLNLLSRFFISRFCIFFVHPFVGHFSRILRNSHCSCDTYMSLSSSLLVHPSLCSVHTFDRFFSSFFAARSLALVDCCHCSGIYRWRPREKCMHFERHYIWYAACNERPPTTALSSAYQRLSPIASVAHSGSCVAIIFILFALSPSPSLHRHLDLDVLSVAGNETYLNDLPFYTRMHSLTSGTL